MFNMAGMAAYMDKVTEATDNDFRGFATEPSTAALAG